MTAVALYVVKLADPVDRLISWLDEIQVGATSFARLVGHRARAARPRGEGRRARRRPACARRTCATRTTRTATSCTGSTSTSSPASASPSSARPARASRRSAACWPGSTRRAVGLVEVGGVRLVDLPLDTLRKEVALVTQEQHVFVGTLAENLRLARPGATDEQLVDALAAVDALEWVQVLPERPEHGRRRRRPRADAGPGAAGRARAARPGRPAHARPRRGDVAPRPAGSTPPRALARLRARRANGGRDRAPAAHGARRGPGRGRRGGPTRRGRDARRARRSRAARTPRSGTPGTAIARRLRPPARLRARAPASPGCGEAARR